RVAELVVAGLLVGVREHGVGLGRLLELLLGFLVARVLVGVVLERDLPVRALDLVRIRVPRDIQNFVVVALLNLSHVVLRGPSARLLQPLPGFVYGRSVGFPVNFRALGAGRRQYTAVRRGGNSHRAWRRRSVSEPAGARQARRGAGE